MYVTARLDYALRALATLATHDSPVTGAVLAERQGVSLQYLAAILNELRRAGLVVNERGRRAGYRLACPADQITVADVLTALRVWPVDVHTSAATPDAVADRLSAVWGRVGTATVDVLAAVTLADVALGPSPASAR